MEEKTNILKNSIRPLLVLQSILGVNRAYDKCDGSFKQTKRRKIYSIALMTVFVVAFFSNVYRLIPQLNFIKMQWVLNCLNLISTLFLFSFDIVCLNKVFAEWLVSFNGLEVHYSEHFKKWCSNKTKFMTRTGIFFVVLLTIISAIVTNNVLWVANNCVPIILIGYFASFANYLEMVLMCVLRNALTHMLKTINDYLKRVRQQLLNDEDIESIDVKVDKSDNRTLYFDLTRDPKCLSVLPNSILILSHLCNKLDEMFNFQVMHLMTTTFCFSIYAIESGLTLYKQGIFYSDELINSITWITIRLVVLSAVCIFCENLVLEFQELEINIAKLQLTPNTNNDQHDAIDVLQETVKGSDRGIFTVCHLFDLRISLLPTFVNLLVTYIIVVSQLLGLQA